ncbi:class I SAM-dependent methyltransferase [Streptomyces viridochromogenes]|uniref:Putative SAM-dependent methyltransferase protein n=1 Tax=Streptomyces viridochromogenes Tue57 TaxID=1160705 RepID=L8PFN1_STRVR|nr:methyltransferase domain-containing protein [Streptomyces viridochromogenes]ELS55195.1 putative SAM-dependent methyltransferase protein [Streptomyces viridochromogenes Tue57]
MHTNTTTSRQPVGGPESYFIRSGYRSRDHVEYFLDETDDTVTWQPDVYPYTAAQAKELDRDVVIDIGCGRAGKLATLADEYPAWNYIGVDFGDNLIWCRDNHPFGEWIEVDLESAERLPIDPSLVRRSIVVCSDVIEHLVNPMPALSLIRSLLLEGSAAAVLSTPARECRSGYDAPGPPRNPSHVREWASDEFQALLRASGFEIHYAGLTRSDDASNGLSTQLLLVGLGAVAEEQW